MRSRLLHFINGHLRIPQDLHSKISGTLLTNMFYLGINFFVQMFLARLLGVEGRGEFAAIQILSGLLVLFNLGLPDSLTYFGSQKPAVVRNVFVSSTIVLLGISLVMGVFGFIVTPLFLSSQRPEVIRTAQWYLLFVPMTFVLLNVLAALRATDRIKTWNITRVLPMTLFFLFFGATMGLKTLGLDLRPTPVFASTVYIILTAVTVLMGVIVVLVRGAGAHEGVSHTVPLTQLIKFGGLSSVVDVLRQGNLWIDRLAITFFGNVVMLGTYTVAVGWGSVLSTLIWPMGAIIFPETARLKNAHEQQHMFRLSGRLGVLSALLLGVPALAVTPFFLPLFFGAQFKQSVPLAMILILSAMISGLNGVIESALRGGYKLRQMIVSECAGFMVISILVLGSLLMLPPRDKMFGIAVSTLCGQAVIFLLLLSVIRGKVATSLEESSLPPGMAEGPQ